jgi:LysM repeat protein
MKKYVVQKGDTLSSIAVQFGVKDGASLRAYHNIYCPLEDLLGHDVVAGKELLIPEDQKYLKESKPIESDESEEVGPMNGYDEETEEESQPTEEKEKKEEKKQQSESSSSEHDGKYFVVQKGMCQCNQGFEFPKFKVTSHQKHYWNDADGKADYLAVTEDDLQLDPPAQPFGQCKLKPSSGGYLPCAYAPAGKWTKTYEKVKVMDKSCVTELSELMCSTGGKITILKHGQQSEAGKSHVKKADSKEQQVYNPIMDFDEFKEETNENEEAW